MSFLDNRPYYWLFGILALTGFVTDQASKYVVFAKLYPADERVNLSESQIIPGAFLLRTHYTYEADKGDQTLSFLRTLSGERLPTLNRGALFGFGNGQHEGSEGIWAAIVGFLRYVLSLFEDAEGGLNTFFAFVSLSAALFILFWATRPNVAQDRYLNIALGLILGGTLGNLYDRIVFGGVRDFLCWEAGFKWPDFNIADSCLVCGACILFVHSFFVRENADEPIPATTTTVDVEAATAMPTSGV